MVAKDCCSCWETAKTKVRRGREVGPERGEGELFSEGSTQTASKSRKRVKMGGRLLVSGSWFDGQKEETVELNFRRGVVDPNVDPPLSGVSFISRRDFASEALTFTQPMAFLGLFFPVSIKKAVPNDSVASFSLDAPHPSRFQT